MSAQVGESNTPAFVNIRKECLLYPKDGGQRSRKCASSEGDPRPFAAAGACARWVRVCGKSGACLDLHSSSQQFAPLVLALCLSRYAPQQQRYPKNHPHVQTHPRFFLQVYRLNDFRPSLAKQRCKTTVSHHRLATDTMQRIADRM